LRATTEHQWWGDGDLLFYIMGMEGRRGAQGHSWNDADELGVLVHIHVSAPHRKNIVGQVTDLVPHPAAGIKKCLAMLPGALKRVHLSARTQWSSDIAIGNRFNTSVNAPGLLWSVLTAYHIAWNQPHNLKTLDDNVVVTK